MEENIRAAIHDFWDALAGQASGDDASLRWALGQVAKLVDAQEAYWMGAVRLDDAATNDPVRGWRPLAVRYLSGCGHRASNYENQRKLLDRGHADPSIIANIVGAGRFRVNIKHELVGREWFDSDYYHTFMAPFGVQDVLLCAMPLSPDVESWWAFQRVGHSRFFFTTEEAEILDYAVRSLAWFHRQVALHHGVLAADQPLTPSERKVLHELLSEKSEKEIADELCLSPATVHTYASRVYRKFAVRGRTGLMALWLGQTRSD
ncbi:response regulator transcription factor [Gilvimarinus sp. F26214L]|uniref:response regulator transcription factor n=1 Tax=Gilvimarinus sp. DZF01 TaxID=3461371 RepID=UPI00404673AF